MDNKKAHKGNKGNKGNKGKAKLTPQKVVEAIKERVYEELRAVVMTKELVDEGYVQKSTLRVVPAERRVVKRFFDENPELRPERAKCLSYLDNGYSGLLAEIDNKIVGHIWWCDDKLNPANVHPQMVRYDIALKPGEVWSFDLFLLEQHRGSGTANDLFALFRKHLREAGYKRVFGHVSSDNLPAVWIHKMQGYKAVKTIEGQLFCGAVLWSEGRLFVKNPPVGVKQKFDFRAIW